MLKYFHYVDVVHEHNLKCHSVFRRHVCMPLKSKAEVTNLMVSIPPPAPPQPRPHTHTHTHNDAYVCAGFAKTYLFLRGRDPQKENKVIPCGTGGGGGGA